MPLGTAKDSIADLQSLVRGAAIEDDFTKAPAAYISPSTSDNIGAADDDGDDDDHFIIDADDEVEESVNLPPIAMPLHQASSLVERSEAMAGYRHANGYDKNHSFRGVMELPINQQGMDAAGNGTSNSDNGNSGRRSRKKSTAIATTSTYTNYDYTDYYAESFEDTSSSPKKKNNVLTCLFPFLQDPLDSDSDSEYDDSNSSNSNSNASMSTNQDEKSLTSAPSVSVSLSDVSPSDSANVNVNGSATSLALGHFDRDSIDVRKAQGRKTLAADTMATTTANDQANVVSTPSTSASSSPEPEHENDNETDLDNGKSKDSSLSSSSSSTTSSTNPQDAAQVNGLPLSSKKPLKGILKRTVMRPSQSSTTKAPTESLQKTLYKNSLRSRDEINAETLNVRRRSILPTYSNDTHNHNDGNFNSDGGNGNGGSSKKKVEFSAMARVLPVLARGDMSFYTKSLIWWQRNDYDDFKKTGRIIAKAMLQGGSEIWLQTSNAWGKQQSRHTATNNNNNTTNQATTTTSSSSTTGSKKYNAEYLSALKKYGVKIDDDDDEEEKKNHDHDDDDLKEKWWCKFGHSRRGLEHIVSIQEGRQRQKLVNSSIQSVLEEQRRQRISSRKDPHKIASISMQYTSWAKDLALAAGEADEEAVRKNFHSKAKGRLAYLSSKLLNRGRTSNSTAVEGQPCASLILSANPALTAGLLDSHTHNAKLLLKQEKEKRKELEQRAAAVMKNDHSIAHQAAGFQFQGSVSS